MDVEAAAMVRLDIPENVDVRSADYRVGLPLTWGNEFSQWKFSYYHVSSHLGDEYWEDHPEFPLFRQARDALVLGHVLEDLSLGEATRRFLEEDEFLVRRRVHRDVASLGSGRSAERAAP